jgi:hypothetical protein
VVKGEKVVDFVRALRVSISISVLIILRACLLMLKHASGNSPNPGLLEGSYAAAPGSYWPEQQRSLRKEQTCSRATHILRNQQPPVFAVNTRPIYCNRLSLDMIYKCTHPLGTRVGCRLTSTNIKIVFITHKETSNEKQADLVVSERRDPGRRISPGLAKPPAQSGAPDTPPTAIPAGMREVTPGCGS